MILLKFLLPQKCPAGVSFLPIIGGSLCIVGAAIFFSPVKVNLRDGAVGRQGLGEK